MAVVSQLAARLSDDATDGDACEILTQAVAELNGVAVFITVVQDEEDIETHRTVLACKPAWLYDYETHGGYAHDPWLAHAKRSSEPRLFADIPVATDGQRTVVALARKHGFEAGLVVPVHAPQGVSRLSVLYIGARTTEALVRRLSPELSLVAAGLAVHLNRWQLARLRREFTASAHLSPLDVQLLRFEWEDRTSKEVARILGSTTPSIDSRWQRLNARLRVTSRGRAARLAAEHGLL